MPTYSPRNEPFCFGQFSKKSEFCRKVCVHGARCLKQTTGEEAAPPVSRENLLETLREDFRRRDMFSLNRHLKEAGVVLTEEDRQKVRAAVEKLGREGTLVEKALVMLWGRIVDTDPPDGVQ